MIKDDGTVIHFNNPKVQASVPANTFAVVGHAESKQITEMLPGILNQLGAESLTHLKRLANNVTSNVGGLSGGAPVPEEDDDDVPTLVGDFDEASKTENKAVDKDAPASPPAPAAPKEAPKETPKEPAAPKAKEAPPPPKADGEKPAEKPAGGKKGKK